MNSQEQSKNNGRKITELINSESILKVVLDTNIIVGYLDENHKFNFECSTVIDCLKTKKAIFFIPHLVMGEFIKVWSKNKKCSTKKSIDTLLKFIGSLKNFYYGGPSVDAETVLTRYSKHSRKKTFTGADFVDFMILTEAENIKNVKIITCDLRMFKAGKGVFKRNIYYLPKSKKIKSHLSRLIEDIHNF